MKRDASISQSLACSRAPLGSVAGISASLQGFVSTLGGALVVGVIGWQFNGTKVDGAGGRFTVLRSSEPPIRSSGGEGWLFRGHNSARDVQSYAGAQVEGVGLH